MGECEVGGKMKKIAQVVTVSLCVGMRAIIAQLLEPPLIQTRQWPPNKPDMSFFYTLNMLLDLIVPI